MRRVGYTIVPSRTKIKKLTLWGKSVPTGVTKKNGGVRKRIPFCQKIADEVCDRISGGETLASICRSKGMPSHQVIYKWLTDPAHEDFKDEFARAREIGFDMIADDMIRIADTPLIGETEIVSKDGVTVKKEDMIQHRKLQVETRFKLLSKWSRKYGDRQILSGDPEAPLLSQESVLSAAIKNLEMSLQAKNAEE